MEDALSPDAQTPLPHTTLRPSAKPFSPAGQRTRFDALLNPEMFVQHKSQPPPAPNAQPDAQPEAQLPQQGNPPPDAQPPQQGNPPIDRLPEEEVQPPDAQRREPPRLDEQLRALAFTPQVRDGKSVFAITVRPLFPKKTVDAVSLYAEAIRSHTDIWPFVVNRKVTVAVRAKGDAIDYLVPHMADIPDHLQRINVALEGFIDDKYDPETMIAGYPRESGVGVYLSTVGVHLVDLETKKFCSSDSDDVVRTIKRIICNTDLLIDLGPGLNPICLAEAFRKGQFAPDLTSQMTSHLARAGHPYVQVHLALREEQRIGNVIDVEPAEFFGLRDIIGLNGLAVVLTAPRRTRPYSPKHPPPHPPPTTTVPNAESTSARAGGGSPTSP